MHVYLSDFVCTREIVFVSFTNCLSIVPLRVIEASSLPRICSWFEAVTINSNVEGYGRWNWIAKQYVVPTDSLNSPDH